MTGDSLLKAVKQAPAFRRILVAVDASEQSEWAAELGARLAEDLSARLALLNVAEPPSTRMTELGMIEAGTLCRPGPTPEDILDRAQFHKPGAAAAERMVRLGIPAEQIVMAAEQWGADLIVMGTHARGRLGRFLLGSTADAVVRRAHCPVVTVGHAFPRPDPDPDEPAAATAETHHDTTPVPFDIKASATTTTGRRKE